MGSIRTYCTLKLLAGGAFCCVHVDFDFLGACPHQFGACTVLSIRTSIREFWDVGFFTQSVHVAHGSLGLVLRSVAAVLGHGYSATSLNLVVSMET